MKIFHEIHQQKWKLTDNLLTSIQVDGNITAPNKIWTTEITNLMTFHAIDNLVVNGKGTIDGQGAIWWDCFNRNVSEVIK